MSKNIWRYITSACYKYHARSAELCRVNRFEITILVHTSDFFDVFVAEVSIAQKSAGKEHWLLPSVSSLVR